MAQQILSGYCKEEASLFKIMANIWFNREKNFNLD